jgi:hypothetical protein
MSARMMTGLRTAAMKMPSTVATIAALIRLFSQDTQRPLCAHAPNR